MHLTMEQRDSIQDGDYEKASEIITMIKSFLSLLEKSGSQTTSPVIDEKIKVLKREYRVLMASCRRITRISLL